MPTLLHHLTPTGGSKNPPGTLKMGQQRVAQLHNNTLKNLPACANGTPHPDTVIPAKAGNQRLCCDSVKKQHEKLPGIETLEQELKEMGNGE